MAIGNSNNHTSLVKSAPWSGITASGMLILPPTPKKKKIYGNDKNRLLQLFRNQMTRIYIYFKYNGEFQS